MNLSRTRMHATWNNDNTHCTAYLLHHLRKILLLSAVSHNHDATVACMHLAAMPSPPTELPLSVTAAGTVNNKASQLASTRLRSATGTNSSKKYDADELRRQHADEHGNVGMQVRLTMEDLDHLDFILQPPLGGAMDEPPLRMGEFLWRCLYHDPPPPTASIPLAEVEREIRQHLELELAVVAAGMEDPSATTSSATTAINDKTSGKMYGDGDEAMATQAFSRLSMSDLHKKGGHERANRPAATGIGDGAKPDFNSSHKEMKYNRLRGTTVLLKPNPPESPSTASVASGDPPSPTFMGNVGWGRLNDLVLSDCSDVHFYLLHPFEHATIAACSGCTIVVGAVAGLLHIVDCEKLVVTTAARRILVSNSSDVQLCIFTPSPPLFVGDNRSCHLAPYNTYYDGMREDLLATGLAAAVISEGQYQGNNSRNDNDSSAAWPPLQCASNKWKQPVEVAKLEVPQVPGSPGGLNQQVPLSPGADDRAMGTSASDATMQVTSLVSPVDFQILFVPLESDSSRQQRLESADMDGAVGGTDGAYSQASGGVDGMESQYCRLLAEALQLSPFRLPLEYERRALGKAERMKHIQQAVQKTLSVEQQRRFEEELNRGFRDWLVTSGNLRQVLDLVHLEVKGTQ
jgi:Tubulin binding cofactor C